MKEIAFCADPKISFKHQSLLQDYHELLKETEYKMKKLEMMKQKRFTLMAEVRFLRRRYKDLNQDQTLETSPKKMLTLSESKDFKVPSKPCLKTKNHSFDEAALANANASCDLGKKLNRDRETDVSTNSVSLPDLNGDGNMPVNNKVSGFDLNEISREEEEPEVNGEQQHMVAEAMKNAMRGQGIHDLHGEIKLPICGDGEKELSRGVKRKVSWQDPVALTLSV
ncbi:unnamed protein product [Cochlearia groenlandica]